MKTDTSEDGGPVTRPSWIYRPEIDGLRSIAVLSVFIFHFNPKLLSGGFVGVDIFFAISGFLITSIILNDMGGGNFSLSKFYQRRIARIAPAFFVVLFATMVCGAFLYSAQDFSSLGVNGAAAALSALNMKLIFQGNYFDASSDAQPLLHYWSLAVEEQFYLIFPIYLIALIKISSKPIAVTIVMAAVSFALCVITTLIHPTFAFYLLPTRAWELLAGSSLALFMRGGGSVDRLRTPGVAWAGPFLILISFLLIGEGENFPGWMAMLPVLGSILTLAAVTGENRENILQFLLSRKIPVFLGKRSYSLYLWHWPIFSFIDYKFFASEFAVRSTLKITLCVVATLLTYALIEKPMREYLNRPQLRWRLFGGFALAVVAVSVVGMEIRSANYFSADRHTIADGGIIIEGGGDQTVALIGDSQGAMYGTELGRIARKREFKLQVLSRAAGNQLPDELDTDWPFVQKVLSEGQPDVVIIAEAWSRKLRGDTTRLRDAISLIEGYGGKVIIVAQPPALPSNATRAAIRNGARAPFFESDEDRYRRQISTKAIEALESDSVVVIDPSEEFLNLDGSIKVMSNNGRFNFQDVNHLSDSGAALVETMLEQAIMSVLSPL